MCQQNSLELKKHFILSFCHDLMDDVCWLFIVSKLGNSEWWLGGAGPESYGKVILTCKYTHTLRSVCSWVNTARVMFTHEAKHLSHETCSIYLLHDPNLTFHLPHSSPILYTHTHTNTNTHTQLFAGRSRWSYVSVKGWSDRQKRYKGSDYGMPPPPSLSFKPRLSK